MVVYCVLQTGDSVTLSLSSVCKYFSNEVYKYAYPITVSK